METNQQFSYATQLPQFPGPSVVTRYNASEDPDTGTAETVDLMERAAIEDSISPQVWSATRQALAGQVKTKVDTCRAIYSWIASRIHFRSDDPVLKSLLGLDNELDLLIRPARLLTMQRPAEDCDGFTMLACSMLLCAGVPCEIVTIKADPEDPGRFSHVYCQAILQDGPLPMDCSQAAQHGYPIGWEAPDYIERKTWGILKPQEKGMHGYAGLGQGCSDNDPACTSDFGIPGVGGSPGIDLGTNPAATPAAGAPFNWNAIAQILTQGGVNIAKMASTPVGYVQYPNGTVANYGAGAAPLNLGASLGSVSPLILLGGGALLLFMIAGRK